MYEELVKALRTCSERDSCFWLTDACPYLDSDLCDDKSGKAADAIEDLSKTLDNEVEINTALECNMPVWIPVTERLPEKIGLYLTYDMNVWERPFEKQAMAYWDGEHFLVSKFSAVTHWMPLPEPPKDGE